MSVMKWIIVKAQGCRRSLGWRGVKSDKNQRKGMPTLLICEFEPGFPWPDLFSAPKLVKMNLIVGHRLFV
jgi:hypothetical protein